MAYLKFSRDKRGYENFYLVQPTSRGKGRPRVLYWFRTPPGVKVGRSPFDPDMRRVLEAQNPDVVFDWEAIANTPIPPPVEPERWRERRRVERAFRAETGEAPGVDGGEPASLSETETWPAAVVPLGAPPSDAIEELNPTAEVRSASNVTASTEPTEPAVPGAGIVQPVEGDVARQGPRRRRRRRGRRKGQGEVQGSDSGSAVPDAVAPGLETIKEPIIQDSEEPEEPDPEEPEP